jgi:ribosome-binding factor A
VKTTPNGPSQRQLRVGELVRHALTDLFARSATGLPELDATGVTVLEVAMSADLRKAMVYVTPFGVDKSVDVAAILNKGHKRVRGLITGPLNLKFMPELEFRTDTTLDHAEKIDGILNRPEVARDLTAGDGSEPDRT